MLVVVVLLVRPATLRHKSQLLIYLFVVVVVVFSVAVFSALWEKGNIKEAREKHTRVEIIAIHSWRMT